MSSETVHFQHSDSVSSFNCFEPIGDPQAASRRPHPPEEGKAVDSLDGNHGHNPEVTEKPSRPRVSKTTETSSPTPAEVTQGSVAC